MSKARYTNLIECSAEAPAKVYLAHDTFLNRDVELKIFPWEGNGTGETAADLDNIDDPRLSRFFREARAVSLLEHPAVPPVLDAGQWDAHAYYYALKLARGETLRKAIDRESTPAGQLRYLPRFVAACRTIAYSHTRRVLHRNLTPDAIVVGAYGEVSVEHWSHAAVLNGATSPSDLDAEIPNLITYVAPEIRSGALGDVRSDVYSLGAILYFILTGQDPPPNVDSVPASHLNQGLGLVCRRALAFAPESRFASVDDFTLELLPYAGGGVGESSAITAERARRRRVVRRKMLVRTALVAAVLIAIIAGAFYSLLPRNNEWAVDTQDTGLTRVGRLQLADTAIARSIDPRKPLQNRYDDLAYWSSIVNAAKAVENGNYAAAREYLAVTPPALRHWEWGYLQRFVNRDRMTIAASTENLFALAYAPDGQSVTVAGKDNTLTEWSAETGELLATYKNHRAEVRAVAYSPDGRHLVSGGWDSVAFVLDRSTGEPIARYQGHESAIWAAAYAPDGSWIATAGDDRSIHAWDPRTGQDLHEFVEPGSGVPTARLRGHATRVWTLAFSPDGRYLVSGDMNGEIRVYDFDARRIAHGIDTAHEFVTSLAVHPSNGQFLAAFSDGAVEAYSLAGGRRLHTLDPHRAAVATATYAHDGSFSVTAGRDGAAMLRDGETNRLIAQTSGHGSEVMAAALNPAGTELATASLDGKIRFWPIDRWQRVGDEGAPSAASLAAERVALDPGDEAFTAIAIDPTGEFAATGTNGPAVLLWNAYNGEKIDTLWSRMGEARAIAYSPDGATLAVGWRRGAVDVWDVESRSLRRHLSESEPLVKITFAETQQFLAVGFEDGAISVWDLAANKRAYHFPSGASHAPALAFHPLLERLAASSADHIRVWSEESPEGPIQSLTGHALPVLSLAYSPGGAYLASGSLDSTVRLWDAESGAQRVRFDAHAAPVNDVVFTPDGLRVISAGADGDVHLLDIATGNALLNLETNGESIAHLRTVDEGATILAATTNGVLYRWKTFPWNEANYPGDASLPLEERIERYKRNVHANN